MIMIMIIIKMMIKVTNAIMIMNMTRTRTRTMAMIMSLILILTILPGGHSPKRFIAAPGTVCKLRRTGLLSDSVQQRPGYRRIFCVD